MQLPNKFPKAIPNKCFLRAWIVVANSGRDVPNPIIVAPMIDGANLNESAINIALSTTNLENKIIKPTLIRNFETATAKSIFFVFSIGFISSVFFEIINPKYPNSNSKTRPRTGLRVPLWTIKRGIIEDMKRNWINSFWDSPFNKTAFLLKITAIPIIIVRFAMFEPKTFPAAKPPSLLIVERTETDNSGREVTIESKTKPAAISDNFNPLEITRTYRMTLSLKTPIKKREKIKIKKLRSIN